MPEKIVKFYKDNELVIDGVAYLVIATGVSFILYKMMYRSYIKYLIKIGAIVIK